jgi:Holliday junction resolvasome RuvABC ATP-dependent DNA helicase subunit
MGAEEAVNQGLVGIGQYLQLKKNIEVFKIATCKPYTPSALRGVWIYGPPGIGKSVYARETYGDFYLKE